MKEKTLWLILEAPVYLAMLIIGYLIIFKHEVLTDVEIIGLFTVFLLFVITFGIIWMIAYSSLDKKGKENLRCQ